MMKILLADLLLAVKGLLIVTLPFALAALLVHLAWFIGERL